MEPVFPPIRMVHAQLPTVFTITITNASSN